MSSRQGWMTWDPSSIAVWEHVPSGIRCRLALEDAHGQPVTPDSWTPIESFLPDGAGHSLAHLLVNANGAQVEIMCGGAGEVAACQILAVPGEALRAHWAVEGAPDGWHVQVEEGAVALAPAGMPAPADINAFLRDQRDAVRLSVPSGEGLLADTLVAMEATLASNTILLPQTRELLTISRQQAEQTGQWHMPNWATFLQTLGMVAVDPALALANCRTALRHLAAGDFLGADAAVDGAPRAISHPPVASYVIWKLFQLTGDEALLREAMPPLLRWHHWWRAARNTGQYDLLSWLSAEETGMPEHPLFAEAQHDPESGLLMLNDIGLTSLWVLDATALMRMALHFNDLELSTQLEDEAMRISDRLNLVLWDQHLGTFHDTDWEQRSLGDDSATIFLSLIAGVPTGIRAHRLVNEHLAQEFNTQYLAPTLSLRHPAFTDQLPWRGRVSALLNWLICEGLRHFGEDAWAERITLSGLALLRQSWQAQHHVYASYHALGGEGNDILQDTLSPSGTLFGALGIGLLLDMEPWNSMRLGNLSGAELAVHGLHLRGERYDVSSGAWGLSVRRNGKPWMETDRPAILRNIVASEQDLSLHAKVAGGGPLQLRLHGFTPKQQVTVKVNGRLIPGEAADAAGLLVCHVELPPAPNIGGPGMDRVA